MKKGQISILLAFFISAIVIIVVAGVLAPTGVLLNTELFSAGQNILLQANDSIANISDSTIRNQIQDSIESAEGAAVNNIEVNSALFKYAWVFVIVMSLLIAFIYTRSLTQVRSGGFV